MKISLFTGLLLQTHHVALTDCARRGLAGCTAGAVFCPGVFFSSPFQPSSDVRAARRNLHDYAPSRHWAVARLYV